jgi:hypothetical protein
MSLRVTDWPFLAQNDIQIRQILTLPNDPFEVAREVAQVSIRVTATSAILVLLRFSGHLKMSAIMRTEVFHDNQEKLQTIQSRV